MPEPEPGAAEDPRAEALRSVRAPAYENPRQEVQAHVPVEARRILDLGCSSGALGAALKARAGDDTTVVGAEADPGYAELARPRLDDVVEGDLADPGTVARLEALGPFDCLIAADVLEHLVDPWSALRSYAELLEPGATAVVSLPNVRHWETLWQLGVRGVWPRRASGIFDRDHLRWFTAADAIGLLQGAGLQLAAIDRVVRVRRDPSGWDRLARPLLRTPLRPFVTFQLILTGRRA
ncbi:MAG TPA: methyltransferase domain-containing protein [Solirubrobacterales bacterium]|nr:methyltransferase domain-containing protein [Solirubrobacterales bacterium]